MPTTELSKVLPTLVFSGLLAACAPLPRLDAVPASLTQKAAVPGIPNARFWLDGNLEPFIAAIVQDIQREAQALRNAGKPADPWPPAYALAISGGGDGGAFAAGILSGWTARGDRPEFKAVTGISAGALIAPFAFLGPQYDEVLRSVATSLGPNDVLKSRGTLMGLMSDGMASSEPLAKIVSKYVTSEVLAAIAREYAKGRVLQIGTTNLDAGRQVTWSMGEIAASSAPGALELFRKIIIASSSIPGMVSPVMIDVEADGRHFQEMHVDGGVISQVFLYPSATMKELARAIGRPYVRAIHAYVIRNGRLEPNWSSTSRKTLDIGGRAISALIENQGINDVNRLYQIALQDKVDFNVAYIGSDFDAPHPEEFDAGYMKKLYEYGYRLAVSGRQWHKAPPNEPAAQSR